MRNNKNNISFSVRNITLNHKILTSFYRILTSHFTGKEKTLTLRFKNITLCSSILIFSLLNIINTFTYASNTSALNYQSSANIGFTFNPTISVSISPNNLIIPNLTPDTAADSNPITVNVSTNTAYGYHLTANVGNNTDNYNTTNLVHASSATSTPTTNATFTSLAYGASIANKDNLPTNTWGYSYSKDNGTTWQSYSGLPLYSDTEHSVELISTYNPANSKTIDFKIAANSSNTQPSGEYTNIINFYAVSNPEPPTLYDTVRYMTKGTLAENNVKLSDTITQANSGVYTYDPAVYGVASDASNDYPIYFYRGILDTDVGLGTYGSDGQADAWPNYVKLNNGTCWRIVRTTGSGGVKMIYNGMYGATTAGSCANAGSKATIGSAPFNNASATINGRTYYGIQYQNIQAVGYTYSNKVESGTTEPTALSDIFGVSGNDTTTNTNDSIIKQFIEDWYAENMISFTNRLEPGAGYCNDRSLYEGNSQLLDVFKITPYGKFTGGYDFGSRMRSWSTVLNVSLSCIRGIVDVYSANNSIDGNNQIKYQIALATADEVVFSGFGRPTGGSSYHTHSFINCALESWSMSPSNRVDSSGNAYTFAIGADTGLQAKNVSSADGVRPAISLMHHIQITGGTGTATSPWTIE